MVVAEVMTTILVTLIRLSSSIENDGRRADLRNHPFRYNPALHSTAHDPRLRCASIST